MAESVGRPVGELPAAATINADDNLLVEQGGVARRITGAILKKLLTGPKGDPGADGTSPKLSVGTVSTLSPGSKATVTMSGTAAAPVLNFGIPKGAAGAAGSGGACSVLVFEASRIGNTLNLTTDGMTDGSIRAYMCAFVAIGGINPNVDVLVNGRGVRVVSDANAGTPNVVYNDGMAVIGIFDLTSSKIIVANTPDQVIS